jgi:hypothetical protein
MAGPTELFKQAEKREKNSGMIASHICYFFHRK